MFAWLWWSDPVWLSRLQVLTGAVGSLLALVAIVYAWTIARRQFKVMDEQTAISNRQVALAEKQDKIIEEQLNKRTDLRLRAAGQTRNLSSQHDGYGPTIVTMEVVNGGNKTADGCHWELFIPRSLTFKVKFVDLNGSELEGDFAPFSNTEIYDKQEGHWLHKIFAWSRI